MIDCGLAQCSRCKVRFVDPRPSDGELSAFYNTDGYDCHNPLFSSEPEIRLKIIERFISPGSLCDFEPGLEDCSNARGQEGGRFVGRTRTLKRAT